MHRCVNFTCWNAHTVFHRCLLAQQSKKCTSSLNLKNDGNHCNAQLFPDCQCLTSDDKHSDLSLPLSQFAAHTDFVSHVDKLMSNDLSLLHSTTRSLYKNIDKLEEIVTPSSNPPGIIALSETRIEESSIITALPGYNF